MMNNNNNEEERLNRLKSRSSLTMQNLSHFFRRGYRPRMSQSNTMPTFCGYSLDRDYSVDYETDRIFKEFLCGSSSSFSLPTVEESHSLTDDSGFDQSEKTAMDLKRKRKTFKKQYSDSVATYYEQKERRVKLVSQRKGSSAYSETGEIFRSSQEQSEDGSDWSEVNSMYSTAPSSLSDVFDYSSADTAMFASDQSNIFPQRVEVESSPCKLK